MGGHWITCRECKHVSRFPHDYMWFDEKNRVHDAEQWRCQNKDCRVIFKRAEPKAFNRHMEMEKERARCQKLKLEKEMYA